MSDSKAKEIAFSAIGNVLVWYDFALFMPFLPIISKHFFDIEDAALRDLATFLVMSAGLFFRPIGSLIFGPLGDRLGRKFVLGASILTMAVATAAIGLIPSWEFSKTTSAIILSVMRIVQGLAMGGAYTAAMVHLVENAPQNRRGFFGSFSDVGNQIGVLMAGGAMLVLHYFFSEIEIYRYAWTIPFVLSGLIIPFACIPFYKNTKEIKRRKKENAGSGSGNDNSNSSSGSKDPGIFESLILYKKQVLCTISITAFSAVAFYTLLTFLPYYLVNSGALSLKDAATCNVIANIFMIISILIGGYLSDIFGRKIFLRIGIVWVAISNYIMFLGGIKSTAIWFLIHAAYGSFIGLYYGGRSAFFAESFPKKIRCTGVSFSLSIAQAIFGGGISMVLNYCISVSRFAVVTPITVVVLAALFAISVMQDKTGKEIE